MANTISISVLADVARARAGIESVDRQMSGFGKTASKIGGVMKGAMVAAGAAMVAAPVIGFLKDSVSAASDLNETISKTKTIFGPASADIMKFGSNAATSMGMSKQAALDGVSSFGNFFNQIGIGTKQSANLSKSFVRMSSDLASFNNANPADVMEAMSAATRGEYDSLQKFIPTINAAKVQQEAMRESGKASADQLTDQDKALALHTLAVKGMGKAQGDFARTSGGLANQQRILSAQFENVKATVGQALLPVVLKVVTFFNSNLIPAFKAVGTFVTPLVAKVRQFFEGLGQGQGKMSAVSGFIQGQLVPAFKDIWKALQRLAVVVLPIAMQIKDALIKTWHQIQPQVRAIWNNIKVIIMTVMQIIKQVITIATRVIQVVWRNFGTQILQFITSTFKNIAKFVSAVMKVIAGVVKLVLAVLKGDWKGAWNAIKQILSGVWSAMKAVVSQGVNTIKLVMKAAWALIKGAVSEAWNGIKTAVSNGISNVMGLVSGMRSRITGFFSGAASWLWNAGSSIISGLIDGITSKISSLTSKLASVTHLIPKWKGPPKKDAKLLFNAGKLIMQGLVDGFSEGEKDVEKHLRGTTARIAGTKFTSPSLAGAGGMGGVTYVINVDASNSIVDEALLARRIHSALKAGSMAGVRA